MPLEALGLRGLRVALEQLEQLGLREPKGLQALRELRANREPGKNGMGGPLPNRD